MFRKRPLTKVRNSRIMENNTFTIVASVFTELFHLDVQLDTRLRDLGIDSLDALNVAYTLESKLNISIPDEKIREFETISDIVAAISS